MALTLPTYTTKSSIALTNAYAKIESAQASNPVFSADANSTQPKVHLTVLIFASQAARTAKQPPVERKMLSVTDTSAVTAAPSVMAAIYQVLKTQAPFSSGIDN